MYLNLSLVKTSAYKLFLKKEKLYYAQGDICHTSITTESWISLDIYLHQMAPLDYDDNIKADFNRTFRSFTVYNQNPTYGNINYGNNN